MPRSAILLLIRAGLGANAGRLAAGAVAISLAGGLLLTALIGQRVVQNQAPRAAQALLGDRELHLAATDTIDPRIDESLLAALHDDARVAAITTATTVRAVDMPGTPSGELDRENFYSRGDTGLGGWIPGRRDGFLAWADGGPRGELLEGRWPNPQATDTIELVVPRVWGVKLGDWRRLESDTGVHRAQVVGILPTDPALTSASQGVRLLARQISPAAAAQLAGGARAPTDARIELRDAHDLPAFVAEWRARLANHRGRLELWDSGAIEQSSLAGPAAESARVAVRSAALLSAAAVVCIALAVQGASVRQRAAQFTLLRALGAPPSVVPTIVVAEGALLAILGWVGAAAVAFLTLSSVGALLPFLKAPSAPDLTSMALAGGVIFAGSLIGSAWPALVAARAVGLQTHGDPGGAARIAMGGAVLGAFTTLLIVALVWVAPVGSLARARLAAWVGVPGLTLGAVCLTPAAVRVVGRVFARPVAWLTRSDPLVLADLIAGDGPRSAGAVLAIAVGLGGFFWMLCWGASMLDAFVIDPGIPRWLLSVHPYGLDREETERVLSAPAFRGFQPLTLVDTRLGEATDPDAVPTLVVGVDLARAFAGPSALPFRFLQGNRDDAVRQLADGRSCLVSDWYATSNGVGLGDTIHVAAPSANGPIDRAYQIAGVVELRGWRMATKLNKVRLRGDKHRVLVVLDADAARRDFPVAYANFLLGNPQPDAAGRISAFLRDVPEEVAYRASQIEREALEANLAALIDLRRTIAYQPDGGATVRTASRVAQVDDLDRTRFSLLGDWGGAAVKRLGVAPLVVLGVSLLSVSGTLVVTLLAQARELGILRSCGLTRWGLARLALAQSLLLGLSAVPIAALLGGGGAWLMLQVAAVVGYRLDFTGIQTDFVVPWSWLWPGAALTAAVCGAAALWAGWCVGRHSPAALMSGAAYSS